MPCGRVPFCCAYREQAAAPKNILKKTKGLPVLAQCSNFVTGLAVVYIAKTIRMCKLKNIRIGHFRGIKTLEMDGFKRANILLGNNNSCKSSALESIMVILGASKPTMPIEMNINRNYSGISKEDILLFFNGLQSSVPITMSADFYDAGGRDLTIEYFESPVKKTQIPDTGNVGADFGSVDYGLRYDYTDNGERHNSASLTVKTAKNEITVDSSENEQGRKTAAFVAPRYNFGDFIKHFNQIVTDKEKPLVLDILRNVEPAIKDVTVVGDKVMVDVGLKKMIPINVLGDGIRKMFTLMTAMYSVKDGILVIDEVDNGLYHKSMSTLWAALLKAAGQLDVQLFVSTHSLDSLNALNSVLDKECASFRDDVNIYTLRRRGDGEIAALEYDYEMFSYLLSREVEIR